MEAIQFLADLYLGSPRSSVFQLSPGAFNTSKVAAIVGSYRKLVNDHPPSAIEALDTIPREVLERMAQMGLFGLTIDGAYGGLGLNLVEYLKVVEEIAKVDLAVALVSLAHLSIGVKGIVLFGSEAQRLRYLVPAASGRMIFAYALTEPGIGSDAKHITTRAALTEDGRHYLVTGQKTYITNANYAGAMTVFAQLEGHAPGFMGAFIVETSWDGVHIGKDMPKMGLRASSTAAVQLHKVRVPVENLLGKPGDGFKIAMSILNYGRLGLGAASVGMMEQSLEDMKKRSSARIQFGVPIKSFPLIQEKMVKAKVYSTVATAMNTWTATLLDQHPLADLAIETSHCKLFGTTKAWDTLYDALQVAGGSGYLASQPYEKRMRDFRVATVFEGTTEIHSIYPPLFLLRQFMKRLKKSVRSGFGPVPFIMGLLGNIALPLTIPMPDPVMRDALSLVRANVRSIRRMLLGGLLRHRDKVERQEFLLRRITTLSLHLFGILTLLGRISHQQRRGETCREDLNLLRYFLEEAKEVRKSNARVLPSKLEALHQEVFRDLFQSHRSFRELP
jgi:acyl-CoA dehydrogenase family member 9